MNRKPQVYAYEQLDNDQIAEILEWKASRYPTKSDDKRVYGAIILRRLAADDLEESIKTLREIVMTNLMDIPILEGTPIKDRMRAALLPLRQGPDVVRSDSISSPNRLALRLKRYIRKGKEENTDMPQNHYFWVLYDEENVGEPLGPLHVFELQQTILEAMALMEQKQ